MRQEKHLLKDGLKEQIQNFDSFVIVSYQGFKSNVANNLRRDVAKLGGEVEMMRKRILLKAAKDVDVELDLSKLPGHIGLVFAGNDVVETLKLVFKYQNETNKAIDVVGGRIDGKIHDAVVVEKISKLPGLKDMQAQFLGLLEAPMSQTLAVMDSLLSSIVYCLDNKSKKGSEE